MHKDTLILALLEAIEKIAVTKEESVASMCREGKLRFRKWCGVEEDKCESIDIVIVNTKYASQDA